VWSHTNPARIGQPNGDVAADHYHKWKADLAFLGQLNATAYRFSISWPRIFPNCGGTVNQAGIDFYSKIIDEVIRQGAEPFLTMYHWDMPQACLDQMGGFVNEKIVEVFTNYADILFKSYGDRVRVKNFSRLSI
jgi:beta-glucosidase/6-phospho-beta-glucosidase/beta-galactosidase